MQKNKLEYHKIQSFIETGTENKHVRNIVQREKYSKGQNYQILDTEITLLKSFYGSSTLFEKKTNTQLLKITIDKNYKILGNNTSPIYIIIKIIFWDMVAILNKKEILNKVTDYRNINILLLMSQIKFTMKSLNNFF